MLRPLTVTTAIDLSTAKRRYSSTYEIHLRMLRLSYARLAIEPSGARRLWSSISRTRLRMLRTVKPATGLSAARKL
jgi:hypothetical protein